ncbi:hypothetical protein GINT2_000590 [Glugoides intestinalis]
MVFDKWKKQTNKTRDMLEVLKNRLEHASYDEDRIDALEKIYGYSLSDQSTETIVELCAVAVLKSIESTEDKTYQIAILHTLYISSSSNSLIEKMLSLKEKLFNILGCDIHVLAKIIRLINSQRFYQFLFEYTEQMIVVLRNLLKNDYFVEFTTLFSKTDTSLLLIKETMVFEGIFEELLNRKRNYVEIKKVLEVLLSGSDKNQHYFVDSALFQPMMNCPAIWSIFAILLQPESKYYHIHQKKLFTAELIEHALLEKHYELVYKLIENNEENFKRFIKKNLKLDRVLEDSDISLDAYRIIELVHNKTDITVSSESSFRINTLLFDREHAELDQKLVESFNSNTIGMDGLIYLLFTRTSIDDIAQFLSSKELEEPLSSMCLLIQLSFDVKVTETPAQIRSKLIYLRLYLLQERITLDFIRESLVETCTQLIARYTPETEKVEYTLDEKESPEIPKEQEREGSTQRNAKEGKIIEEVNNTLKGLFENFKIKRESYDL